MRAANFPRPNYRIEIHREVMDPSDLRIMLSRRCDPPTSEAPEFPGLRLDSRRRSCVVSTVSNGPKNTPKSFWFIVGMKKSWMVHLAPRFLLGSDQIVLVSLGLRIHNSATRSVCILQDMHGESHGWQAVGKVWFRGRNNSPWVRDVSSILEPI